MYVHKARLSNQFWPPVRLSGTSLSQNIGRVNNSYMVHSYVNDKLISLIGITADGYYNEIHGLLDPIH